MVILVVVLLVCGAVVGEYAIKRWIVGHAVDGVVGCVVTVLLVVLLEWNCYFHKDHIDR